MLVLRIGLLDAEGEDRFLELAVDGLVVDVSRKFFATCWVMVDAPTGRRPEPMILHVDDEWRGTGPKTSTPGCLIESSCLPPRGRPPSRGREWPGSAGTGAARGRIRPSARRCRHARASSPAARSVLKTCVIGQILGDAVRDRAQPRRRRTRKSTAGQARRNIQSV
jgi:hypothetical protein